ncbi:hypothetical protein [Clostridioides difficile]|uniref:hypothetical protein n=1 Tax=Clostridioides difficile TaxID=1496 RepID=UPI000D1F577D|nr:hypothetical protein [Clostridioides difficile]HBE9444632.1 hypothetical protein [Clostridioides difficile]
MSENIDLISQFVETLDTSENVKNILKKLLSLGEESQEIVRDFIVMNCMVHDEIKICMDSILKLDKGCKNEE